MTLDSEIQRQILLSMIEQMQFPGKVLEEVFDLKRAIVGAEIAVQTLATTESDF